VPEAGRPLILVNPTASRLADDGRRARIVADIEAAVVARTGVAADVETAVSIDDARASLERAADERRALVVVAGGDGTVREAAHDLAGSGIGLGIVPLGTANLFAASVGIPLAASRAIATIAEGRFRSVDIGRARWTRADGDTEERLFAVACGAGFDARLMAATSSGAKRRFGRYGYFMTAVGMLPSIRGFEASIVVDGERHELEAVAVLIANAGQLIPGVVRPALPIRVADGLLDVIVVAAGGLGGAAIGAMEALGRRALGRSATGRSLRLLGAHVRVETSPAQQLEVDGDVVGVGALEAACLPSALRIVVPRVRDSRAGPPARPHDTAT